MAYQLTYRQRQEKKYLLAIRKSTPVSLREFTAEILSSRKMFRAVEAAIESTAEGRQNRKTAGWEAKKSRAHSRAAATIK